MNEANAAFPNFCAVAVAQITSVTNVATSTQAKPSALKRTRVVYKHHTPIDTHTNSSCCTYRRLLISSWQRGRDNLFYQWLLSRQPSGNLLPRNDNVKEAVAKKIVAATAWVLVCYVVSGGGKRLAGAKYCPRLLARSPRSSLALSPRPLPLPTRPSVSAYGGSTSKQDAFTRCSGYIFEEEVAAEGISTHRVRHQRHGRHLPLLVLRCLLSLQIFSRWFALLYIDKVNYIADDMFEGSVILHANDSQSQVGHEKTKKRKINSNTTTREVTTREARRYQLPGKPGQRHQRGVHRRLAAFSGIEEYKIE